jgi:hypothetical protein
VKGEDLILILLMAAALLVIAVAIIWPVLH